MNIVVTTGSPNTNLQMISSLLRAGGLADPRASGKAPEATIQAWHQRLMSSRRPKKGAVISPFTPGKAWEQALGEIFLANLDQNCWGWADARSTWLLDFLADYDSQFCFVLVFDSPQAAISLALLSEKAFTPESAIVTWQNYNQALLRFYNRNAERCILVNAEDCLIHPKAFVNLCRDRLDLELSLNSDAPLELESAGPVSELAEFLSEEFLSSHPEMHELYLEMEACAIRLNPVSEEKLTQSQGATRNKLGAGAIHEFAQIQIKNRAAEKSLSELAIENERLLQQINHLQKDLEKNLAQQDEQQNKLALNQTEAEKLRTAEKELHQENERLLLLHLHEMQEELEHYFLQHQKNLAEQDEQQNKNKELETQSAEKNSKLAAAEETNLRLQAELRTKLALNQAEVEKLRTAEKELHQENERLLQQADHLQKDLEKNLAQHGEQQNKNKELEIRLVENNSKLAKAEETNSQLQAELKTKLVLNQTEVEKFRTAEKELHQENELLLLQLHQVQEELERHFLQQQQEQKRTQQLENRLNRLQIRWPSLSDWSSIEILSVDHTKTSHWVEWQLADFCHGGRTIPQLHVKTIVEDGHPGLILRRGTGSEGTSPLMRWPAAIEGSELVLVPGLPGPLGTLTLETLTNISASDWFILRALCDAIISTLQQPNLTQNASQRIDVQYWLNALVFLKSQITKTANIFRFDNVVLYREQVNPDYEYLWLKFSNIRSGDMHLPNFTFRLSAASVRPGKFSVHPKLEFPLLEGGQKPLESWFEESYDDFGPKTELRFELTSTAMDLVVWNKLSARDQVFVAALIAQLQPILTLLESQGIRISRPWNDWKNFVAGIIKIMQERLLPHAQTTQKAISPVVMPAQQKVMPAPVKPAQKVKRTTDAASKQISSVRIRL